jgi:hypothetical protein
MYFTKNNQLAHKYILSAFIGMVLISETLYSAAPGGPEETIDHVVSNLQEAIRIFAHQADSGHSFVGMRFTLRDKKGNAENTPSCVIKFNDNGYSIFLCKSRLYPQFKEATLERYLDNENYYGPFLDGLICINEGLPNPVEGDGDILSHHKKVISLSITPQWPHLGRLQATVRNKNLTILGERMRRMEELCALMAPRPPVIGEGHPQIAQDPAQENRVAALQEAFLKLEREQRSLKQENEQLRRSAQESAELASKASEGTDKAHVRLAALEQRLAGVGERAIQEQMAQIEAAGRMQIVAIKAAGEGEMQKIAAAGIKERLNMSQKGFAAQLHEQAFRK